MVNMESVENKKQIVYILSALDTTEETIHLACTYRFQRITPDYVLIYDEDIPDGGVEITAKDLSALSDGDMEWLQRCNMTLLNEFAEKHADSQKKSLQDFLKELEENIKKELEIADKEGVEK